MSPPPPSPPIWRSSKDVPRGNLFLGERTNAPRSRSSQKCDVSAVLAVSMSIWFDRWRKISESAINELPEGNNFEGEDIIFALFSPIESLLSLHPAMAAVALAAAGPEVIGGERRIHWKRRLLSDYELRRRTTISRDAAVGGSGGGSVEQNDSFDQFSKLTQQEAPFSHFDFSLSPLSSLS